jgi:hypothetical protein
MISAGSYGKYISVMNNKKCPGRQKFQRLLGLSGHFSVLE